MTTFEVHVNGKRVAVFRNTRDPKGAESFANIRVRLERRRDPSANVVLVKDTVLETPKSDVDRGKGTKKVGARKTGSGRGRKPTGKKRVGTAGVDSK